MSDVSCRYMIEVACVSVDVVRCTLYVVRCTLYVVRCTVVFVWCGTNRYLVDRLSSIKKDQYLICRMSTKPHHINLGKGFI